MGRVDGDITLPIIEDWKQIIMGIVETRSTIPAMEYITHKNGDFYQCGFVDGVHIIIEIPKIFIEEQMFGHIADRCVAHYLNTIEMFNN